MAAVAAGEDSGNTCLKVSVSIDRIVGKKLYARSLCNFIFGNQSYGQHQGIAVYSSCGFRYHLAVLVKVRKFNGFKLSLSYDFGNSRLHIKRNSEFLHALADIAGKACRGTHYLRDCQNLRPLERESSGHDQADVSGTEDDHALSDHHIADIHQILRNSCRKDACRPASRNRDVSAGSLPAACGKDNGSGPVLLDSVLGVDGNAVARIGLADFGNMP